MDSGPAPTDVDFRVWGCDPQWSRTTTLHPGGGDAVRWHYLDSGTQPTVGTLVCVHGNPTWSYAWKHLLADPPDGWRVVAVDQTNMGFSQRVGRRRLDQRVDELAEFCAQHVEGPVVFAAHDWGGPVAVAATPLVQDVRALVLCNTAVGLPDGMDVPPLIRAARRAARLTCQTSPLFVAGTARMADRQHRRGLSAPYRSASRRTGVYEFVDDIPLTPTHPSWAALERSAQALTGFDGPVLYVWGDSDPVFHSGFLADMVIRRPDAQVAVLNGAGHLVTLHADFATTVARWLPTALAPPHREEGIGTFTPVTHCVTNPTVPGANVVYDGWGGVLRRDDFVRGATTAARNFAAAGVHPGDRVAVLAPLSPRTLPTIYGVWLAGGVVVVAEPTLGVRRVRQLLRSASPQFAIVDRRTAVLARAARLAPHARRLNVDTLLAPSSASSEFTLPTPDAADLAAVVHTSGATGPAKPVRYTHGALAAQRDALAAMLPSADFTTSFSPFALLAPALGVACRLPRDPRPNRFHFPQLRAAVDAGASMAWLSPRAAANVVASAAGATAPLQLAMIAGAPVPPDLARDLALVTGADVRCPYGMTEALPVTDGTNPTRQGPLGGLCTGRPLPGAVVRTVTLDDATPTDGPGELVVACPWMYDGYDRKPGITASHAVTLDGQRFHRTGDYGYVHGGDVYQLGRTAHIIPTAAGPLGCVAVEQRIQPEFDELVAAVGVGGSTDAQVAVVVDAPRRLRVAAADVADRVRAAADRDVVAVLCGHLPVDRRHATKVDRVELAAQVNDVLEGR